MEIAIIIICALVLIQTWVCVNLFRKNTVLEKALEESFKDSEHFSNSQLELVNELTAVYEAALKKVQVVARNGSFETDDETGFIFETLKKTVADLHEHMTTLKTQLNQDADD